MKGISRRNKTSAISLTEESLISIEIAHRGAISETYFSAQANIPFTTLPSKFARRLVAPRMVAGELLVVDAEQAQHRRLQIVDMDRIFCRLVTELVARAVDDCVFKFLPIITIPKITVPRVWKCIHRSPRIISNSSARRVDCNGWCSLGRLHLTRSAAVSRHRPCWASFISGQNASVIGVNLLLLP